MSRTKGSYSYSDKQVLTALHKHMVTELCSKYSMSKPTWQAILKRMSSRSAFADKVKGIEAEALKKWEQVGLKALVRNNTDFNTALYKMFVGNKVSFQTYGDIELEDRLKALEDQQSERKTGSKGKKLK